MYVFCEKEEKLSLNYCQYPINLGLCRQTVYFLIRQFIMSSTLFAKSVVLIFLMVNFTKCRLIYVCVIHSQVQFFMLLRLTLVVLWVMVT